MKLSKANAALLASVVVAMANTETPYLMASEKEIAGLTKEGLVETNAEIRDGDKIAVRATDKGIEVNNSNQTETVVGAAAPAAAAATGNFVTGNGFVPSAPRGGRGRQIYDFDGLPIGGFIFVPATEAKPNPAKSLASTVSSASKRSAPKKFAVQSVEAGKQYGEFTAPANGAVIYRAADIAPATA
jgi:hypothetical protein